MTLIYSYSSLMYSQVTQEVSSRKKFGPTKYLHEKILDTRITHEKKSWTHETSRRKNFGPTKYPREKISDPQRHDGPVARDPRNLAHSSKFIAQPLEFSFMSEEMFED